MKREFIALLVLAAWAFGFSLGSRYGGTKERFSEVTLTTIGAVCDANFQKEPVQWIERHTGRLCAEMRSSPGELIPEGPNFIVHIQAKNTTETFTRWIDAVYWVDLQPMAEESSR